MTWDIARSYHKRDFLGLFELSPADDDEAESFTKRMKETLRAEIEKEIDERKLAEFEWLSPIVSRQVTDMIKLAIGRPEISVVILEGETPEGFIDFNTLYSAIQEPGVPKEIGQ